MNETRVKLSPAKWERVAAFACFAGSILSLALGFAFTTDWLLSAARHPFLHAVGFTLLIIGIPILILGGHCLDVMEKKNTKSRREDDLVQSTFYAARNLDEVVPKASLLILAIYGMFPAKTQRTIAQ